MALNTSFQKIFSSMVLRELEKAAVFVRLVNRDYEGEIRKKGDSVNIPVIGAIDVNSYTRGTDGLTLQEIEDGSMVLTIDNEKYAAFTVDDIDKLQAGGAGIEYVQKAAQEAAYALIDDMDSSIADLYAQAGDNVTDTNITSATILGKISELRKKAVQLNWPTAMPWHCVVGPNTEERLLNAKILTDTNNSRSLGTGFLGSLYGFDFYTSNNVANDGGTEPNITEYNMAFLTSGITHAQQITKMESGRLTTEGFGDYVKMLNVYGNKVVLPRRVLKLELEFATETAL